MPRAGSRDRRAAALTRRFVAALACIGGLAWPALATAQGDTLARSIRVSADNDYFDFWRPPDRRPDDNYTQGVHIAADVALVPPPIRRLFCDRGAACGATVEIGQELYTPTDDSAQPLPGERPYAGWLYARGGAQTGTAQFRRTLDPTLGVTGQASLAEQTQETFHQWIHGFRRPLGWSNQLPTELAGALRMEEAGYSSAGPRAHPWIDLMPAAHATLGTLRVSAGLSARSRVGVNLRHPWLVAPRSDRWAAYVILGGAVEPWPGISFSMEARSISPSV